jgi:hypothetical protein
MLTLPQGRERAAGGGRGAGEADADAAEGSGALPGGKACCNISLAGHCHCVP